MSYNFKGKHWSVEDKVGERCAIFQTMSGKQSLMKNPRTHRQKDMNCNVAAMKLCIQLSTAQLHCSKWQHSVSNKCYCERVKARLLHQLTNGADA